MDFFDLYSTPHANLLFLSRLWTRITGCSSLHYFQDFIKFISSRKFSLFFTDFSSPVLAYSCNIRGFRVPNYKMSFDCFFGKGTRLNSRDSRQWTLEVERDKITVPTFHKIVFRKLATKKKYIIRLPQIPPTPPAFNGTMNRTGNNRTGNLSNFWVILKGAVSRQSSSFCLICQLLSLNHYET